MADAVDDPEVYAQLAGVRPELDPIVRSVMRANARAAVFGLRPTIEIGRYQLLREVGSGGGGAVFVARDPELDREIAIKLIVAASDALRARAFSEGQALARLSHPNIVPVFDVGVHDERVYLVMELVRGEPLRRFADHATVRQIVSAYRQAGEGLAAAHAAGLVHRDFKPDNAVIGADGRVRVIDFGLARAASDEAPHGAAGTPRYMAPEQRAGEAATGATDQYAFAVSLREAVGEPVPRWLDAVVRRGASEDPGARFVDMAAMLRALANDPRRRWRRRVLVAVPITFAVVGFALGRGRDEGAPVCDGTTVLAPTWNAQRSAALEARIARLATPFAVISAPRAKAAIDSYGDRWIAGYNAACVAARRQEPMADRRAACLARARLQLGETIELLEGVIPAALPATMSAIAELPDLARCADETALVETVAPPPPALAREVTELTGELDRAQVSIHAARQEAVPQMRDLVERVRALEYQPLLARALLAHGRALLAIGERQRAIAPLREATQVALAVADTATAVEAYAREAWAKSTTGVDPAVAVEGLDLITALANQLGPRDRFVEALLHNNVGTIENALGDRDRARKRFETALALARDVEGPGRLELAGVRSNLALVTDDPAERQRLLDERVAIVRTELGDDHPFTLDARMTRALLISDDVQARAASRPICDTYARVHPSDRVPIVDCASELAWLQLATDDLEGARTSLQIVLAADGPGVDPDRVALARGYLALLDRDPKTAHAVFEELAGRARPTAETRWWDLLFAADVEIARAFVARGRGSSPDAFLGRAIGYLERAAKGTQIPIIERRLAWARAATAGGR